MKTLVVKESDLLNIEEAVRSMDLPTCYHSYEKIRELRTELIQKLTGKTSLCLRHERDLTVYERICKPDGFTNEDLKTHLGYDISGLPYHMVDEETGLIYKQSENGGLSMSRGAAEFRKGDLLTELTIPSSDYTITIVE